VKFKSFSVNRAGTLRCTTTQWPARLCVRALRCLSGGGWWLVFVPVGVLLTIRRCRDVKIEKRLSKIAEDVSARIMCE